MSNNIIMYNFQRLRIETVFKVVEIDNLTAKKFVWTITIEEVTFQIDEKPPSTALSESEVSLQISMNLVRNLGNLHGYFSFWITPL